MARPKYKARPDANQPAIIERLEAAGLLVVNVSSWLPTPDLFVWGQHVISGEFFWTAWEIKVQDGKLTGTQKDFIALHPGAVEEARTFEKILRAYGRIQ